MQKIIIDNFGPIKHAEIEVRQFTIVIGEQASGKTYLSKLVYFFQKLPYTLYDFAFFAEKRAFAIEDFQNKISKEFFLLFNSVIVNKQEFAVEFMYGTSVGLKIFYKSNKINVGCDHFEKMIKVLSRIDVFDPKLVRSFYRIFNSDETSFNPFHEYKEAYIPAGRAFTNIFPSDTRLKIIQKLPDDYFFNFIRRIENVKDEFNDNGGSFESVLDNHQGFINEKTGSLLVEIIAHILKASYLVSINGEKLVFNRDKFVTINNASSGQQESLRILQDLFLLFIEETSGFRAIEEPEAHLFPTAQKKLVEFMSIIGNSTGSSLFISTHSPYILSAFNNLLFAKGVEKEFGDSFKEMLSEEDRNLLPAKESWIDPADFIAYSLKSGGDCSLIFDKGTGMIDENYLDDVSMEIADEFNVMFGNYKKLKSANGK